MTEKRLSGQHIQESVSRFLQLFGWSYLLNLVDVTHPRSLQNKLKFIFFLFVNLYLMPSIFRLDTSMQRN